jgi:hypothetical protein
LGSDSPSIIQTNNNNNNNIPNKTTNAKSPKLKQKQRRLTDRFGFYLDGTRDGKQTSRRRKVLASMAQQSFLMQQLKC